MRAIEDLTGKVFGRLTVIGLYLHIKGKPTKWECRCICGDISYPNRNNLVNGTTQSCGCLNKERSGSAAAKANTTHGFCQGEHRYLYHTYRKMISRCENVKDKHYNYYGGRGITVCNEWKISFRNFLADMGLKPSSLYSLDRIDNNGNYCKENCRWATKTEQVYNRRNTLKVKYKGAEYIVSELIKKLNVPDHVIERARARNIDLILAISRYKPRKKEFKNVCTDIDLALG